jgi:hypothetical protein
MVSTHDAAPAPVAKLLDAASATAEWRHPTVSRVAPISSDRRVAASKRAKVASIGPKLSARVVLVPSATRVALADYTLRDSSKAGCCDCHFRNRSRDMTCSRPSPFLPSASVMAVAPAVAARGGRGTPTAAAPKTSMGDLATVGVANGSLGSILLDSSGRTVSLFEADSGTKSACTVACATAWSRCQREGGHRVRRRLVCGVANWPTDDYSAHELAGRDHRRLLTGGEP